MEERGVKGFRFYVLDNGIIEEDSNNLVAFTTTSTGLDREVKNKMVDIPVWCVLFKHPDLGWFLFDTGCHPDVLNGRCEKRIIDCFPYHFTEKQTLKYQLDRIGVRPEEINLIVLSHWHFDHAGGLEFFPNAKVICSRADFDFAAESIFANQPSLGSGSYLTADFLVPVKERKYIDEDCELARGVELITLPGHSPCVLGLVAHLENGTYIFPSDAINVRGNYGPPARPCGQLYDSLGFFKSIEKVRKIAEKYDAKIMYSHDIEVFNEFKKAPEFYE